MQVPRRVLLMRVVLAATLVSGPLVSFALAQTPRIPMFCTLGGAPVLGCCEGRTTFIPGFIGQVQVSVHAELTGAAAAGIIGAEFYVEGLENLPGDWVAASSPAVAAGLEGDLVTLSDSDGDGFHDDRRGQITFASCRASPTVTLALLTVWSHDAIEDLAATELRVVGGSPPSDPLFDCPLLILCDAPAFTKVCAEGTSFEINPRAFELPNTPFPVDGSVNVARDATLCWRQQLATCVENHTPEVHFGTKSNPTWIPCQLTKEGGQVCCDPGLLEPNTTYYWRVLVPSTGHSPPPWRFTTGERVGTERSTWSAVKRLYR